MSLKILIIGQGGREHAIAWKLSKSDRIDSVFVAPGNGGTFLEKNVTNVDIKPTDTEDLIKFVKKNSIDLTIVGPEAPLVGGIVNKFNQEGLKIFGPTKEHAQLEGSKVFAKSFMEENKIPTATFQSFSKKKDAKEFLKNQKFPLVIKADGLASGKGVIIADTLEDGHIAIDALLDEKKSTEVVIEKFLTGIELSAIYICNYKGEGYEVSLPWVKDYKSRDEYNSGPNTGGMGAISHPLSFENKNFIFKLNLEIENILKKTIISINKKSKLGYLGFLYIGLMIDKKGRVSVLEYNCRLGDPETQNIMMSLDLEGIDLLHFILDIYEIPKDIATIAPSGFGISNYCCTIVLAAQGYPGEFKKDFFLDLSDISESNFLKIFHAGTIIHDGKVKVTSGRILTINVIAKDKDTAIKIAYENIRKIKAYEDKDFQKENNSLIFFREDIGN